MSAPTVILLGSKPGSVVALEAMLERGWRVMGVIPSGDHGFIGGPNLRQLSEQESLPIYEQDSLPEIEVDFVISYMFRNRVKARALSMARRAALNFHAGPLPEFGGWAFYNVAILESASEYGCTCHHMDEGLDTGPVMQVRRFPIDPERETAFSLEQKAQIEMVRLFEDFMDLAESDAIIPVIPQDTGRMRYMTQEEFQRLKKVPSNASHQQAQRIARAFFYPPYECAYLTIGDLKLEILPESIKPELGDLLHVDDLCVLRNARRGHSKSANGSIVL